MICGTLFFYSDHKSVINAFETQKIKYFKYLNIALLVKEGKSIIFYNIAVGHKRVL